MGIDAVIVLGYVVLLVGLSLRGGREVADAAGFSAAGKQYGTFVIFATLSASYVGGGYSSGNAAEAFSGGIGTTVTLFGFSLSMIAIGKWIAPKVDRFRGLSTAGEVMEQAYGRSARIATGFFSFCCCAGVVGAQMETMGVVFHSLLGLPPAAGILLGGGLVLFYSTFGGMQSVIVADVLQFLLLAAGMPVLLFGALYRVGGLGAMLHAVPEPLLRPLNGQTLPAFLSLCGTMAFGEALAPPYTQRLLIGRNARVTARGTVLSGLFSVPFFLITGLIGLSARALQVTDEPAEAMPALIDAVLPVGLRGVVMAAMVSIMLSASDSFLNSAAISLVRDTVQPLRALSARGQLRALRLTNLITGLTAMAAAFLLPDVFSILRLAYALWCPLIVVPLGAALWGVRSCGRAFRRGLFCGLLITLLWNTVLARPLGIGGDMMGMLGNFLVFNAETRRYQHYRCQRLPGRVPPVL